MDLLALLFSFCGGGLGAALGALVAFVWVGFGALYGIVSGMAGVNFDWLGLIPFGVYFGPDISFGSGCCAAAYARKKGYMPAGKDIIKPLISLGKPDVILVGGIWGIIAFLIRYGLNKVMPGMLDSVAATVFLQALIAKVVYAEEGGLLERVFGKVPEETRKLGGRFSVFAPQAWLPWQCKASQMTVLSIAAGGLSAYTTYLMLQNPATKAVAPFVGFAIGVGSFVFMLAGHQIPVFHHISLCASYAVVQSGGSLLWGLAGGLIGAFIAEWMSRLFYCYGDCHVDPPGMTIAVTSFLLFTIVPATGLYADKTITPLIIIALAVLYSLYQEAAIRKRESQVST